jgi:chromosome segregation ATPase
MKEDKNRLTTQVEKQIEKIEKLKIEIEEKDALIVNTGKTHEEKFALKQI